MIDPELDLTLHRVIRAPRQRIWQAWTQPEKFASGGRRLRRSRASTASNPNRAVGS